MVESFNQLVARIAAFFAITVGLPVLSWLSLFVIARELGQPLRSIPAGIAMFICMCWGAAAVSQLTAAGDWLRGRAVWGYFARIGLLFAPSFGLSIAVGGAFIYFWPSLMAMLEPFVRPCLPAVAESDVVVGYTTFFVALVYCIGACIPVLAGTWVVTHHTLRKFEQTLGARLA